MSPFLTDEVNPELSPSPSQGNTAPHENVTHCFVLKRNDSLLHWLTIAEVFFMFVCSL